MTMKDEQIKYSTNDQFNVINIFKTPKINATTRTFFWDSQNITLPLASVHFSLRKVSLNFFRKILLAV